MQCRGSRLDRHRPERRDDRQHPDPDAFRREIGRIHPVGRTGTPEEVAALVAFPAAEEAGFITGQVYAVDGGGMARLSLP